MKVKVVYSKYVTKEIEVDDKFAILTEDLDEDAIYENESLINELYAIGETAAFEDDLCNDFYGVQSLDNEEMVVA